jgi:putative protease
MSPAGYWPQLRAAIDAGADAVYFGLKHFTARAKVGFDIEELPEVMSTLHARGVRGFVTFNTLVFENELKQAADSMAAIARAGADALIIQDLGIARLARQIAPDIEIHASTQMSITSAEGVAFARSLGVDRVTLARELSLAEIRAVADASDCELEIFVHGALCVAYSGQCFSSEAWGGRSANRGQCAQTCRLPYDLLVDGGHTPLGDARYLLSPGDLCGIEHIPDIIQAGVSTLKIEGRYKDAEYVALTTSAYRKAVDEAWAGRPTAINPLEKLQLEQIYSRGLGPYFLTGTNHQAVVDGRAPRHRGVFMGRVLSTTPESVIIEPAEAHQTCPLKPGDGVVFDAADWRSPEEAEEGGRVYAVESHRGTLELQFANNAIRFNRIRRGDLIWRTHDPDLERSIRAIPVHKQPVHVHVTAREGEPLITKWSLQKLSVTVQSPTVLTAARSESVKLDQLGRLGNTPYYLDGLELETTGSPFIPASLLNQLRREAVDQLQALQTRSRSNTVVDSIAIASKRTRAVAQTPPQLHLLVRTAKQLDAALQLKPASITLDYLDLYGLRPSIERIKAAGIPARVSTPRILKPGEEKIVNFLLSLECEILVRATGILEALRGRPHPALIGDFSLNAANSLTTDLLLEAGLARITPTHDLNAAQITELASDLVEVVAYQHLPVFHTEHCVFCRFLSTGTSYRDCGRPCEKHEVALRDHSGRQHPVIADVGCRNTVFGAEAQHAAAYVGEWLGAGIRHFRLEFVHETAEQLTRVTEAWQEALEGRIAPAALTAQLRRAAPQGITEGSLLVLQ